MILVCVILFLALLVFLGCKFQNWVEKESKKNERMDLQRAMILAYRRTKKRGYGNERDYTK